jgi:hypothetical protein
MAAHYNGFFLIMFSNRVLLFYILMGLFHENKMLRYFADKVSILAIIRLFIKYFYFNNML